MPASFVPEREAGWLNLAGWADFASNWEKRIYLARCNDDTGREREREREEGGGGSFVTLRRENMVAFLPEILRCL